jgi:hypothetical protein
MDCKSLQKDYSKLNVKAVPAQGGVADKLASGGAAIGFLGALTGNRDLANVAQQATALKDGATPAGADDNLKKIQMVASAKGCSLI